MNMLPYRNAFGWALAALALPSCGLPDRPLAEQRVVASVNGVAIDARVLDALVRARQGLSNPFDETALQAEPASVDTQAALQDLVLAEVLAQAAIERGLDRKPDVAAELALQRKTLLGQQLVRELLGDIDVSAGELERRYRDLPVEQEYDVRHVLVADEATAQSLIAQLDQGARIETLARRHTIDPQSRDGRLGWLMPNQLERPFAEALEKLAPGQHTARPVHTSYGWHVARLQARRALQKPPFEEVRAALREQVLQERLQTRLQALRADADVQLGSQSGPATLGSGR
ncbi:peptidylprolyl isomerase [Schlegelella sp. S2-27]|uniref:peptidylprolyl isomerase n=1 Tax=Caldimonas mangrovi TaxID=2944811 RepID=A0ABT0YTL0_9BURK|nr:peptidylprolyl isomerase [Caldimonas mangrovi]MCM5681183.1 peptidylprolyl isomerase [Caldimonas mangrovi]